MNLTELLQKQADIVASQRTMFDKAKNELRDFTPDEAAEFENLGKQLKTVENLITTEQSLAATENKLDQPAAQVYRPTYAGPGAESENNNKLDDGGFKNLGELLLAVKDGDRKGRIKNLSTSDAGILIPPAFSQNILRLQPEKEIVCPRSIIIPAGDPPDAEFVVPYFQQGADGANGGVVLTWTGEGAVIPDTNKPGIKDLTLKPQEVSGLATINNKTLQNWQASGAFVTQLMEQAFVTGRDYKCLRGAGVGTPLGVLHSGNKGAIRVARKTAGTVTFEDFANMTGRMLPDAMDGAVWVISISNLPVVTQMKDENGRLIYLPGNVTQGIPATILGLPVIWTGKTPIKGSEGDVALVNFQYYLCKSGSGPYVALSEHVKFTSNQTVFRIVAYWDGQPWVKEPLTLEDGKTTVSPYVILK